MGKGASGRTHCRPGRALAGPAAAAAGGAPSGPSQTRSGQSGTCEDGACTPSTAEATGAPATPATPPLAGRPAPAPVPTPARSPGPSAPSPSSLPAPLSAASCRRAPHPAGRPGTGAAGGRAGERQSSTGHALNEVYAAQGACCCTGAAQLRAPGRSAPLPFSLAVHVPINRPGAASAAAVTAPPVHDAAP
jgi:hypothetical protein